MAGHTLTITSCCLSVASGDAAPWVRHVPGAPSARWGDAGRGYRTSCRRLWGRNSETQPKRTSIPSMLGLQRQGGRWNPRFPRQSTEATLHAVSRFKLDGRGTKDQYMEWLHILSDPGHAVALHVDVFRILPSGYGPSPDGPSNSVDLSNIRPREDSRQLGRNGAAPCVASDRSRLPSFQHPLHIVCPWPQHAHPYRAIDPCRRAARRKLELDS